MITEAKVVIMSEVDNCSKLWLHHLDVYFTYRPQFWDDVHLKIRHLQFAS